MLRQKRDKLTSVKKCALGVKLATPDQLRCMMFINSGDEGQTCGRQQTIPEVAEKKKRMTGLDLWRVLDLLEATYSFAA